jgi:hypothetical protein
VDHRYAGAVVAPADVCVRAALRAGLRLLGIRRSLLTVFREDGLMKITCPNCRGEHVKVGPSGVLARCLSCLYSWVVSNV